MTYICTVQRREQRSGLVTGNRGCASAWLKSAVRRTVRWNKRNTWLVESSRCRAWRRARLTPRAILSGASRICIQMRAPGLVMRGHWPFPEGHTTLDEIGQGSHRELQDARLGSRSPIYAAQQQSRRVPRGGSAAHPCERLQGAHGWDTTRSPEDVRRLMQTEAARTCTGHHRIGRPCVCLGRLYTISTTSSWVCRVSWPGDQADLHPSSFLWFALHSQS